MDSVVQLERYLDLLNRDPLLTTDKGIACPLVDYDTLRGLDDPTERLF